VSPLGLANADSAADVVDALGTVALIIYILWIILWVIVGVLPFFIAYLIYSSKKQFDYQKDDEDGEKRLCCYCLKFWARCRKGP
jgi:hypothetical protein